jgi:hypothetical protein
VSDLSRRESVENETDQDLVLIFQWERQAAMPKTNVIMKINPSDSRGPLLALGATVSRLIREGLFGELVFELRTE